MRLALVNGLRAEPTPRQAGICHYCGSEMVAKCGRIKIWHWAHKSRSSCDPWWESEGEWHRRWKGLFPLKWQEVIHINPKTGEKHIADIKTSSGLVIEFQNSPMNVFERRSRENFYGKMIWVVNGDRDTLDSAYFKMGLFSMDPINLNPLTYGIRWMGHGQFLPYWASATADVYFDFGQESVIPNVLWRLVSFELENKTGAVQPIPKEAFIKSCISGKSIPGLAIDKEDIWKYRREMVHVDTIDGRDRGL